MANLAIITEVTINDIEKTVQDGLEALRNAPLNDQITAALKFLTPQGHRPVVQLQEDGRKKRSTAAASNWNPATGEVFIYFEPLQTPELHSVIQEPKINPPAAQASNRFASFQHETDTGKRYDPVLATKAERHITTKRAVSQALGDLQDPLATDEQIRQLCVALAEAEKIGRAFISIKKFRDEDLVSKGHGWANSLAHRQAVLARAIELGAVVTSQIPNPKAPQHPTTVIRLNRESDYASSVTPRFHPIKLRGSGSSASEIVIADRGRF